jgi:hypothetical protein
MSLRSAEKSNIALFWLYNVINRSEAFERNYFLLRYLPGLNAGRLFRFQLSSQFIYFHMKQKFKNRSARNVRRRIFQLIFKTITEIPRKQHRSLLTTALTGLKRSIRIWNVIIASVSGTCNLPLVTLRYMSRDSSVGIATGYGLDDQEEREFECR